MTGAGLLNTIVAKSIIPDATKTENDFFVLYVCGLPLDMDELMLYKMFAPFGSVLSVYLQRKTSFRDYVIAFVNFGDQQAAETAISAYNGMELPGGKFLKVTHKPNKKGTVG